MKKLNVCVIGCGYWGPNLVRNLYDNMQTGEIHCVDLDDEQLKKLKLRYSTIKIHNDYREVLRTENIDAFIVSTPISTHYPIGKELLEAKKHIFIEKPLAKSEDEANELINIAKSNGVQLMVGHTFEYSPAVIKMKELISEGGLGEIYYIFSTRVNLGLHQKDVSVIWDLCPHDFSILFSLLGEEPEEVSAFGRGCIKEGLPDIAFINLKFKSGIVCNVTVSWLAPTKLRKTVIAGKDKMLVYDDTDVYEKIKIFDKGVTYFEPGTFGEYQLSYRSGDVYSPKLESYEPLAKEIDHFLTNIITGGQITTDGHNGLRVVKALVAADRSLNEGGKFISI